MLRSRLCLLGWLFGSLVGFILLTFNEGFNTEASLAIKSTIMFGRKVYFPPFKTSRHLKNAVNFGVYVDFEKLSSKLARITCKSLPLISQPVVNL